MLRIIFLVLTSAMLAGPALAGGPTAMVKSHGDHRWLTAESVPCGMVLESLLRERGFEVIERTLPESRAALVVTVDARCSRIWGRPQSVYHDIKNPESNCSVDAIVRGPDGSFHHLDASGSSNTGHLQAVSAACNQLADRLDHALGTAAKPAAIPAAAPRKLSVVLRWEGELSPMPLVVATGFFGKAGYKAELREGGPDRCVFSVEATESTERLGHLLETYLQSEYTVSTTRSDATGLELLLSARTD